MTANASPLEPYKWQSRILLVFYNAGNDKREIDVAPRWNLELSYYARHESGIMDRDMMVLFVTDNLVDPLILKGQGIKRENVQWSEKLFEQYSPAFADGQIYAGVLIGKDGTVKKRWDKLPPVEEVFSLIDTMPMRQREMRQNNYND